MKRDLSAAFGGGSSSSSTISVVSGSSSSKEKVFAFPRLREHVEGDWPSLVYLRVPKKLLSDLKLQASRGKTVLVSATASSSSSKEASGDVASITNAAKLKDGNLYVNSLRNLKISFAESDLDMDLDPHISLSKPFTLRTHFIDSFVNDLKTNLKSLSRFFVSSSADMLDLLFLPGDESTSKQFLVSVINDNGSRSLGSLVDIVNGVMSRFGKATYFKDPIFHISIFCWMPAEANRNDLSKLNNKRISDVVDFEKNENSCETVYGSERESPAKVASAQNSTRAKSKHNLKNIADDDNNDDDDDDVDDFRKHSVIIADDSASKKSQDDGNAVINFASSKIVEEPKLFHKLQVMEVVCAIGNKVFVFNLV